VEKKVIFLVLLIVIFMKEVGLDIPEHVDPLKAGMFWNVKVA